MTIFSSNVIEVTVTSQTQFGQVASATAPGTFSAPLAIEGLTGYHPRLDPQNTSHEDFPDCAGGTAEYGYDITRAWIWLSRFEHDDTGRRLIGIVSPHQFDEIGGMTNGFMTLLTIIDKQTSTCTIMENPFSVNNAVGPRTIGHGFDNIAIAENRIYKWTTPYNPGGGAGWIQPQICMVDLPKLTLDRTSGENGAAMLGYIVPPNDPETGSPAITAGSMFYLPGPKYLVTFHKHRLYPTNIGVNPPVHLPSILIEGVVLPAGQTQYAIHNLGHFHPILGKGVFGGGAYNPGGTQNSWNRSFFTVSNSTDLTVTQLDDAPYTLSVSETDLEGGAEVKACFAWDPLSVESLAFTDRGEILALNPNKPAGQQWRTVGPIPSELGEVDWVCSDPLNQVIWIGRSRPPGGLAEIRCYKTGT